MPLVASVDYVAKRIYLSAETVDAALDMTDVYREVRELRRTTDAHRAFRPMIVGGGNVEKITGSTYTQPYVQLLYGCRVVPYDAPHSLRLIRDTFTDDGASGVDCFDRTTISSPVDIDVVVQAVEVRVVTAPAGVIADAVWDAARVSHTGAGSFGRLLGASMYAAKVLLIDDNAAAADRYVVTWFRDGVPLSSGVTSATLRVVDVDSGADLVATAAMMEVGALGRFKYDTTTARLVSGRTYLAIVSAVIDGGSRVWEQPVGRDSFL